MSNQQIAWDQFEASKTDPPPETPIEEHRYYICTYDVLGSDQDGYEVNDMYRTNDYIELLDDASEHDILVKLKAIGYIKLGAKLSDISCDDDGETIVIDDANNGCPLFELRKED